MFAHFYPSQEPCAATAAPCLPATSHHQVYQSLPKLSVATKSTSSHAMHLSAGQLNWTFCNLYRNLNLTSFTFLDLECIDSTRLSSSTGKFFFFRKFQGQGSSFLLFKCYALLILEDWIMRDDSSDWMEETFLFFFLPLFSSKYSYLKSCYIKLLKVDGERPSTRRCFHHFASRCVTYGNVFFL